MFVYSGCIRIRVQEGSPYLSPVVHPARVVAWNYYCLFRRKLVLFTPFASLSPIEPLPNEPLQAMKMATKAEKKASEIAEALAKAKQQLLSATVSDTHARTHVRACAHTHTYTHQRRPPTPTHVLIRL